VAGLRAGPRNEDGLPVSTRVESLKEAADLYGRAAATSNDDSQDARLRQARALQLLGKGDLAEPLFREVLSGSTRTDTRYLAALFLGLLAGDDNRPHEAVRYFEEALTLRPGARSVRVAWSHAAFRADDRRAARFHVLAASDPSAASLCAEDPWCLYDFGDAARSTDALEQLLRALAS
jgi:tetratricopeptide (TPR) repeat protein